MDGAANPYLLQAGVVVAGLDGIENERDPGKRTDLDLYAEGHKLRGARKLPLNLLDALRLFEKDRVVRAGFGESFVKSYVKLKMRTSGTNTPARSPTGSAATPSIARARPWKTDARQALLSLTAAGRPAILRACRRDRPAPARARRRAAGRGRGLSRAHLKTAPLPREVLV